MTNVLRPFLPLEHDESALSWACRLALFHTGEPIQKFLNDLGIPQQDLWSGRKNAMRRLAEATGVELGQLTARQPQQLAQRFYSLRGETFRSRFLVGTQTPFCPLCLAEDDRSDLGLRAGRWPWHLSPYRTCEIHGVAMAHLAKRVWSDQFHDLNVQAPRGRDLDVILQSSALRSASPLQRYVVARLKGGNQAVEWLDGQGLEEGARAAEMLGVLAELGPKPDLNSLSEDEWDRVGRVGYEIVSGGEAGIRDFLLQVLKGFPDRTAKNGPQAVFGRLYQWLQFDKSGHDRGPIRALVRDFIVEEMAVEAGTDLFGEVVEVRKRHNSSSLARKYSLHPKTVHRALVASGLVNASDPTRITGLETCDAEKGEELIQAISRGIPVNSLPKQMNATRAQVAMLIKEGYLAPILKLKDVKSKALGSVDRLSVEAFLKDLSKSARVVSSPSLKCVPIPKAAEKASRLSSHIVSLLLEGRLDQVQMVEGTSGYLAILVDPNEVEALLPKPQEDLPPNKTEAGKLFGVTPFTLNAMLDGAGGRPLLTCIEDGKRGQAKKRFNKEQIQQFRLSYVTLGELKKTYGQHHAQLLKRLETAKVSPIRDPKKLRCWVFERTEAIRALS